MYTSPLSLADRYGRGSWAIVTGSSDGMGAEYCRQLTKAGFNIVLISRTKSKMDDVGSQLIDLNTQVQTKVITADFCGKNKFEFYEGIVKQVEGLDISMVILNAGMLMFGEVDHVEPKDHQDLLDTNIYHVACLSKLLLPMLLKRGKRTAFMVNGSSAALRWLPWAAVYSGTKMFDSVFVRGLNEELRDSNVDF